MAMSTELINIEVKEVKIVDIIQRGIFVFTGSIHLRHLNSTILHILV